ncbi:MULTISPECIES: excinuclease ABC subunit UvrA [unclassified Actinomyces]|uniref:excinuclease ABC subunit UvrA n=1 Tax=unclassified Actinomyces TaxID=2609248 RepID=UPI002016F0AA|nr:MULTISPECIES: excinuclease ABC subunit UvrA [unclassified Actinomyces]MCL3777255.1 excinuclease ABC subunit UvrA [Actinomyces sp. AC-20-1]MCL3789530.1 excinuclease ABC subunit UvrA [Actinomyces sp. 187325]MCL3792360.1 excinuclease ABC subunit UvrA [Actinomyces sp. 186855]MCL3793616.1 excinuclease ABC subunit UvrA [Actinomyces sp. 217892]
MPSVIQVRGARVHNLRSVDVDVPLGRLVAVAGVSGSGKSSLALGTLYAEGARRYLESLSTYTRRRLTQAARPDVDEVLHVPAALALHQRPPVPGVRSTFGTSTEVLSSLRLAFSRLGHHACPNGHLNEPTTAVALEVPITCSTCAVDFLGPGAEELAFNSGGACPTCEGTGTVRTVDESTLVPDESLSIDEGAVAPWQNLMWSLMKDIAREMGVRTHVPFRELTDRERETVLHGPAEKRHILYVNEKTDVAAEMDFTYYSAVRTVENALSKVKDERGMRRVEKFLHEDVCPDCGGSRLSAAVRATRLCGTGLDEACRLPLGELVEWVSGVPATMPEELRAMAEQIVDELRVTAGRLMDLGLGYLSLDRASMTLSTGERQRVQLARAVRNRTTGVLYVLDEPSIGLHPHNLRGLTSVVEDLLADGNSVLLVDHDARLLRQADWLLEIGPGSGAEGGAVVLSAPVAQVVGGQAPSWAKGLPMSGDPADSLIRPFLTGRAPVRVREEVPAGRVFDLGRISLETAPVHTVHALEVSVPQQRLTAVTGVSGSGKTTLVLEALVPALRSLEDEAPLPLPATSLDPGATRRVVVVDATPIGANVRSTVATYSGVMDGLRRAYAALPEARAAGLGAGDFSYNTGSLRCEHCDGTGQVVLDVQFLPDVEIECPACEGTRYGQRARQIRRPGAQRQGGSPTAGGASSSEPPKAPHAPEGLSLPELLSLTVSEAARACADLPRVRRQLRLLVDLGLGYLTLGEATPTLSGGEAQRLKLSTHLGSSQAGTLFVLDEPSIGLHPLDVRVLLGVLDRLIEAGATVVVIEHDLDMIANADWVVDMGPGGGEAGGRVVAAGTPSGLVAGTADGAGQSLTARYLAEHLAQALAHPSGPGGPTA